MVRRGDTEVGGGGEISRTEKTEGMIEWMKDGRQERRKLLGFAIRDNPAYPSLDGKPSFFCCLTVSDDS